MSHDKTMERLTEAVHALSTDEGFRRWLRLRTQTTIGRYSIGNQILIAAQMPEATRVAGYRAWQREGCQVRKGEKAIWILAPIKRPWTEVDKETGVIESHSRVFGFTGAAVFDASQLSVGPEVPAFNINPTGESVSEWEVRLVGYAATQGIEVQVRDTGAADGWYDRTNQVIALSDRLDVDGRAHTLVHELVHHHGVSYEEYGRQAAELITETATAILCVEIGLDSLEESSFYLLSWADGKSEEALKHLQMADGIARKLEADLGVRMTERTMCAVTA